MRSLKAIARTALNRMGFDVIRVGSANADLEDHLRNVLRLNNIDCVIDVGANVGQYGEMLRRIGYGGYVVSFEPVKDVFDRLSAKAKGDKKWLCYNMALGDREGRESINVYDSTEFSSFLPATEYSKEIWNSLKGVRAESVLVMKLDSLFGEILQKTASKNCFLKLDTQGFDVNVFRGSSSCIDAVRAMQSEISFIPVYDGMPVGLDVLEMFNSEGFLVSGMFPINRDESLAVIEFDCVLVRSSSPAARGTGAKSAAAVGMEAMAKSSGVSGAGR